jgi:hypothetical protein
LLNQIKLPQLKSEAIGMIISHLNIDAYFAS